MSKSDGPVTRVAAAQIRPIWLDPTASTRKAIDWLEDSVAQDVQLVAFPETFLGGYPFWVEHTNGAKFEDSRQKRAYAEYLSASIETTGPEVSSIVEASKDLGVFVYMGALERATDHARGTVFCSLLAIDPAAGLVGVHRKLMPTYEERLVWGFGDGYGLRVHQLPGLAVGGLNCWENWMPQARYALYAQGEDLHVSVWPGHPRNTVDLTRFIAQEGRVYSLAANGLISLADVPRGFSLYEDLADLSFTDFCTGGSGLAAPDGTWIEQPTANEERLVVGDVDRAAVYAARQNFDPCGHYSRPDVFDVRINRTRHQAARFDD